MIKWIPVLYITILHLLLPSVDFFLTCFLIYAEVVNNVTPSPYIFLLRAEVLFCLL